MRDDVGLGRLASVVRRRRLPVLITSGLALALGLFAVARVPSRYQARVILRLDDPRPAREYVPQTVPEPGIDRMKSRRLSFLARPIVLEAAGAAGLLPPETAGPDARERVVAAIAARLDARQEGEDTFVVTYEDTTREGARAFLSALGEAYTTSRATEMAKRAQETAAYFEREVESLRPRVAEKEAEVERYRLEHYGSLPDQLESNLRVHDETTMELHTLVASLDAAMERRQELIAESTSPLRRQEEEAGRSLSVARARYAPDSPEVKNLEAELARVHRDRSSSEDQLAEEEKTTGALRAIGRQLASTRQRIDGLRVREKELRARIDAVARNGEVLARMALDRDVLRDRLKSLVSRHEDAVLAAGLEAGTLGHNRVTLVEPAWATTGPVKPARMLWATLVLGAAVLAGLGVAFLLDVSDRRVRSMDDVHRLAAGVPVLGVVPDLGRLRRGRTSHGGRRET